MIQIPVRIFFFIYRWIIGPALHTLGGSGFGCRFHPHCSAYSLEAFKRFPFFKALRLSLFRILRCNPWHQAEIEDPLPSLR